MDISLITKYFPDWPLWSIASFAFLAITCLLISVLQTLYGRERFEQVVDGISAPYSISAATFQQKKRSFRKFQWQYLSVYLIVMLADWLQGTNMYTLYQSYGVNISSLFLTGFLSSAVFGTFLGIFVDQIGRKRGCIVFCLLEILINYLEHFPDMTLLLIGRVLGGLSTSLLFSAFETWMVSEHRKQGYPEEWLADTFSLASMGNGLVAIAAGVIAQVASDWLGDIGPFQAAIALTGLALTLLFKWNENYGGDDGNQAHQVHLMQQFKDAWKCIKSDPRISLLGLCQSFFEGGMYTFVFMWVPTMLAIVPNGVLPTGLVFSSFMVCITIGGMLFSSLLKVVSVEDASLLTFGLAAFSMAVPAFVTQFYPVFASFLLIEVCVGAFFVGGGTLRSKYLPDSLQSSIMNIFRLPLNILVVLGTKLSDHASPFAVFLTCSSWFAIAFLLQLALTKFHGSNVQATKKVD